MKILIINDYLQLGGAEVYINNLRNILLNNNKEVYLLNFEEKQEFKKKIATIKNKENIINIPKCRYMKINKIIFNFKLYIQIRKIIKKINPDKIILNNIFYSPITQLKALKEYEVYNVIHDYSIVCPKSTLIINEENVCKGYKENNCLCNCTYHNKLQLVLKLWQTKAIERLRKKIIKKFISPSECLNNMLKKYDYNSVCINNPIDINRYK